MTAPTLNPITGQPADTATIPENAVPIEFPVLALEGMETADRRFIEPGALTHRAVPLTIYAQTRTPEGGQGHDGADIVGALTELVRRPGSEVTSKSTGQPFPDDVAVWSGKGWMYTDVPAYRMVKDGALSGNSVDLSAVDAQVVMAEDDPDDPGQMRMTSGVIGATTLVGLPAFPDAYVVLDGESIAPAVGLTASMTPMWRSSDLGDACSPCLAGQPLPGASTLGEFATMPLADQGVVLRPTDNPAAFLRRADGGLTAWQVANDDGDGQLRLVPSAVTAAAAGVDKLVEKFDTVDATVLAAVAAGLMRRIGQTAPWEQVLTAAGNPAYQTSGMVSLVPDDPESFAVDGGDPADEMHCTLAFLGDDVDQWTSEQYQTALDAVAMAIAGNRPQDQPVPEDPSATGESTAEGGSDPSSVRAAGGVEPDNPRSIKARVMGHATWNADGGPTGTMKPATVYDLGDSHAIHSLRDNVVHHLNDKLHQVGRQLPPQHGPFKPHITAGYGVPQSKLSRLGPVSFSKVRAEMAGQRHDFPLDPNGEITVTAAAYPKLPAAAFANPNLTGPTPLTFTDVADTDRPTNGPVLRRVFGHIATWGTCHIGFGGQCVTAPRSASAYAYFHTGQVLTDAGPISTGHITFGTGHASDRLAARPAVAHYDHTGTVGADVVCGEDAFGIWVSGVVRDHLTPTQLREFVAAPPSGDWRNIGGNLELVAVLSVNTPGFPVPRARVASGMPMALVAGGVLREEPVVQLAASGKIDMQALADAVLDRQAERARLGAEMERLAAVLDDYVQAEHGKLSIQFAQLTGETLAPPEYSSVVTVEELHERLLDVAGPEALFATLCEHFGEVTDADIAFAQNWVQKAGGLPKYIDRIRKHLEKKAMDTSRAIATAVNVAKKMCATGDLQFPGLQHVNPGSRAEACSAVADWNAKRAKSKAS
jgi:hypothetical protein